MQAPLQPTLDQHNEVATEYLGKLLERHSYGEPEENIRLAFRDFILRTGIIADERESEAEIPPGSDSVRRVDLRVRNTYVEFKRNIVISGRIDPGYTRQLDEYLLESVKSGWGIQNGILTDGRHYLKRNIGDHILPVAPNAMQVFDRAGQGPRLREYLNDIIDTTAQDIIPSATTLTKHLGIDSDLLKQATALLKDAHDWNRDNPTVAVKRKLWQELLQVALGQDSTGDPETADWLYIRHTYLTTLVALILQAHFGIEIVQEAENDPAALLNGATLNRHTELKGVIESDLFQWAAEIGESAHIRAMAHKVAQFDWTQRADELAATLYQNTISPEERRRMGEYYTPRWLTQAMVDELITEPADTVVLDPACGSGTFIESLAQNIIKSQEGQHPSDTLAKLQQNIIGIDLHPVAVQLAKATWVLNSHQVISAARVSDRPPADIAPPIYLGDSLQLRYDHNNLDCHGYITLQTTERLPGEAGPVEFQIPMSLARQPDKFDLLMLDLANAIDRQADLERVLDHHQIAGGSERDTIRQTAKQMGKLHAADRNHIWAYYLRNMVRPAVIAEQKVDAIVSNPPWLTYNRSADIIREELRKLSEETYGIWAGGNQAPHQDVATLFFCRATDLYLKDGGKIGMVLPHSALRSGQHLKWRGGYWEAKTKGNKCAISVDFQAKTPWDLDNLEPNTFFPMPSSVVFAQAKGKNSDTKEHAAKAKSLAPGQVEIWRGRTDTPKVTRQTEALYHDDGKYHSDYAEVAMQGPTIVDRRLFFVTTQPNTTLMAAPNTALTFPRVSQGDKKQYDVSSLAGMPVHENNLFDIYLGESLAPYVVLAPQTAVLPVDKATMTLPLDRNARELEIAELDERMQNRWLKMAALWDANKGKSDTKPLIRNLNWLNKLTSQLAYLRNPGNRPVRIAYTTSGRPTAALITDNKAILDTSTYQVACHTIDEAHYLLAIINSDALADAAKPFCPTNWARKIRTLHKSLWKLPIPEFDADEAKHTALASLGKNAADEAAAVIKGLAAMENKPLTSQKARAQLRNEWQPASATAQAIEERVRELLTKAVDEADAAANPETFGQKLLQEFLKKAPQPDLKSTDEDGFTGIEWVVNDRVIQLEVAENATAGRWLTWVKNDPAKPGPFQEINLQEPATWQPLLELLNC